MNILQFDTLLFLRLAGSRTGVERRHVPLNVISAASNLGGKVSFGSRRVVVRNAPETMRRLLEICGISPHQ